MITHTWCTKKVKRHGRQPRIRLAMFPPPNKRIANPFKWQRNIFIEFVNLFNPIHGDVSKIFKFRVRRDLESIYMYDKYLENIQIKDILIAMRASLSCCTS